MGAADFNEGPVAVIQHRDAGTALQVRGVMGQLSSALQGLSGIVQSHHQSRPDCGGSPRPEGRLKLVCNQGGCNVPSRLREGAIDDAGRSGVVYLAFRGALAHDGGLAGVKPIRLHRRTPNARRACGR